MTTMSSKKNQTNWVTCSRCGEQRLHYGRNLCATCYKTVSENGTRDMYPTRQDRPRFRAINPDVDADDQVRLAASRLHAAISALPSWVQHTTDNPFGGGEILVSKEQVLALVVEAGKR